MLAGARAVTLPALAAAGVAAAPSPREETRPPVIPLRLWPLRRRRRPVLNEPMRPKAAGGASSSQWELYQWHKRMGSLHIYFDLYPAG